MSETLPDWAKPGASAVIVRGSAWDGHDLQEVTISRITTTQVIVEAPNMRRFVIPAEQCDDLREKIAGNSFHRASLIPHDDPRIARWRTQAALKTLRYQARTAAEAFDKSASHETGTNAVEAISAWLDAENAANQQTTESEPHQ